MKKALLWVGCIVLVCFLTLAAVFYLDPEKTVYKILTTIGIPSETLEKPTLADGIRWHDDHFTVHPIDEQTFAIGEPRYWQRNVSYLVVGRERALLFDTGSGFKDISRVVLTLTNLPIIAVPSHLHYDHVAGIEKFDQVGLLDLPELRRQVGDEGIFQFQAEQHLGSVENTSPPKFVVSMWLAPNSEIDLGGRVIKILSTPGHTPDSLMLYDAENKQLFAGDFIYPGALLAILPGAHLGDYLRTTVTLRNEVSEEVAIFAAHGAQGNDPWKTPELKYLDLVDLWSALVAIRDGTLPSSGFYPRVYKVNDRLSLWTPFARDQKW